MRERSERVESPGTYVTACIRFTRPFFWRCVLSTALLCSSVYHLKRGGMSLHDAVGINYKKGTTTKNQLLLLLRNSKSGICWWLCVCYLTWHDYPSLGNGESHCILLVLYIIKNLKHECHTIKTLITYNNLLTCWHEFPIYSQQKFQTLSARRQTKVLRVRKVLIWGSGIRKVLIWGYNFIDLLILKISKQNDVKHNNVDQI